MESNQMKTNGFSFLLGLSLIAMTACNDEIEQPVTVVNYGDEILFGASGEFDVDAKSRTSYGNLTDRGTYPIYWESGDQISIYCAEAGGAGGTFSTYSVTPNSSDPTYGSVQKTGEAGLQWGNPNTEHKFYAFYPQSAIDTENTTDHTIVAEVPTLQRVNITTNTGTDASTHPYIAESNMNYAMMGARTYITPNTPPEGWDGTVSFDFKPIVTAVDVTIRGNADRGVMLTALNVTTREGQPLAGSFKCDLDKLMSYYEKLETGTPTTEEDNPCEYANLDAYVYNMVTVDLRTADNTPITLGAGQELTVTVFLLPHMSYDDVTFSVAVQNAGSHRQTLPAEVSIPAMKKSLIALSPVANANVNTWMGSLDPDIYISELSIPGTAVSASQNATRISDGDIYFQTQNMSLTDQFNMGIRYFDFPSIPTGWNGDDLYLISGGQYIGSGMTFSQAMDELAACVAAHPSEFIYVVPYFQPADPDGGTSWQDGDFSAWLNCLGNYMSNHQQVNGVSIETDFSNDKTIKDVARNILVFARNFRSSDDGSYGYNQYNPSNLNLTGMIYGWNADKDRWEARGASSDAVTNWFNEPSGQIIRDEWVTVYMPSTTSSYMKENWGGSYYRVANRQELLSPHTYIMDWPRVSDTNQQYDHETYNGLGIVSKGIHFNWRPSNEEKVALLKAQLTACVEQARTGHDFYITSLDGFYVVNDFESFGATTGQGGNMPAYANYVNNAMSDFILNGMKDEQGNDKLGSLGIVVIDYAGLENYNGTRVYGERIPQVIIDNNFKFPLREENSSN